MEVRQIASTFLQRDSLAFVAAYQKDIITIQEAALCICDSMQNVSRETITNLKQLQNVTVSNYQRIIIEKDTQMNDTKKKLKNARLTTIVVTATAIILLLL